jgi:5-methylthioadenosine/S-adenosylhomocysteine deaminase
MSGTHILASGTVLTMDAEMSVILDGAIAIEGQTIADIGSREEVLKTYPGAPVKNMGDALLMPGLINAHAHSGMLRGTAEHLPVWEWLTTAHQPHAQGAERR